MFRNEWQRSIDNYINETHSNLMSELNENFNDEEIKYITTMLIAKLSNILARWAEIERRK